MDRAVPVFVILPPLKFIFRALHRSHPSIFTTLPWLDWTWSCCELAAMVCQLSHPRAQHCFPLLRLQRSPQQVPESLSTPFFATPHQLWVTVHKHQGLLPIQAGSQRTLPHEGLCCHPLDTMRGSDHHLNPPAAPPTTSHAQFRAAYQDCCTPWCRWQQRSLRGMSRNISLCANTNLPYILCKSFD